MYGSGGTTVEGLQTGAAIGGGIELTNNGTEFGGIDWLAQSLTFDTQINPEDAQFNVALGGTPPGLRDLVSGSEWSLRRLVGKVFVSVKEADGSQLTSQRAELIECGFGIIVCNTDEDGAPLTDFNEVNPLAQQAAEDPWVFMRHWILGTAPQNNSAVFVNSLGVAATKSAFAGGFPTSNVGYGSVMDGPHVDAKTSRRIRRDQRLFSVFATRPTRFLDEESVGFVTSDITVYCRVMLRALGNIRSSSGNRGNAAR